MLEDLFKKVGEITKKTFNTAKDFPDTVEVEAHNKEKNINERN